MLIYHGTKSHLLENVRANGLQPRGSGSSQWSEAPSRPDLVYLTSYGHFFYGRDGTGLSVVELDLDRFDNHLLLPDEDYLHQVHRIPLDEARERLEEFQAEWPNSLRDFGTCAFKGHVPATSIQQACFIDLNELKVLYNFYAPFEIMETGLDEFRSKGKLISQVTGWVFGHSAELPPEVKWDPNHRTFIRLF